MKVEQTNFPGLAIIHPTIFKDDRGYFYEVYHKNRLEEFGLSTTFIQDNESKSQKGVLRGLHYQTGKHSQAKLVRVSQGAVWDVVVDLRINSPTYKEWFAVELNEQNKLQLYIPKGFAHGFLVLSETAVFNYKCDNYYNKESEAGIHYLDNSLNIEWPELPGNYIISEKDKNLGSLLDAPKFASI